MLFPQQMRICVFQLTCKSRKLSKLVNMLTIRKEKTTELIQIAASQLVPIEKWCEQTKTGIRT